MIFALAFAAACSIVPASSEFVRYPHVTSTGIAARRDVFDADGRVIRRIYYGALSRPAGGAGMFTLEAPDEATARPVRSETTCHDVEGYDRVVTRFRAGGVREREHRVVARSTVTTLHFDADGERVIGVHGRIPGDVAIDADWGPAVGGLRSSIALDRPTGSTGGRGVRLMLVNEGEVAREVAGFDLELRDAAGRFVPSRQLARGRLDLRGADGAGAQVPIWIVGATIEPGHARHEVHSLHDWFGDLPLGDYSIEAVIRTNAGGSVRSNTRTLRITARWRHETGREYVPDSGS